MFTANVQPDGAANTFQGATYVTDKSLANRYADLSTDREPYLMRARSCAALTQPSICPPMGQTPSQALPQTYTSFGYRGLANLASKLMMALIPPGESSFNLEVDVKTLMKSGNQSPTPEIIKGLAQCEQLINTKIEALGWRRQTYTTVQHLAVNGNVVEYIDPDGKIKVYRLDQFVCVRDWDGCVTEIITAEAMKVRNLKAELKPFAAGKEDNATVTLYTTWRKGDDDKTYFTGQSLDDKVVSAVSEFKGLMPANALTWELVPGEAYGRSYVESLYADLNALDQVNKQLQEAGAVAARNLIFVKPNAAGGNLRKRIATARNGDVLSGNGGPNGDIQPFQFNNSAQMQVMASEKQTLERSLSQAFLLTSNLTRDAERVTAYELQQLASEIEQGLGGVYSLLGVELQGFRMKKLYAQMVSRKELPNLGKTVNITITTGLEALGKDAKVKKVQAFFQLLNEAPQEFQQTAAQYVKFDTILTPAAAALGFPESIKTEAEVEQEQAQQAQQQHMQQMQQNAAGPAAGAIAQAAAQPQDPSQ